jgi:hypothetical protein
VLVATLGFATIDVPEVAAGRSRAPVARTGWKRFHFGMRLGFVVVTGWSIFWAVKGSRLRSQSENALRLETARTAFSVADAIQNDLEFHHLTLPASFHPAQPGALMPWSTVGFSADPKQAPRDSYGRPLELRHVFFQYGSQPIEAGFLVLSAGRDGKPLTNDDIGYGGSFQESSAHVWHRYILKAPEQLQVESVIRIPR